MSGSSNFPTAVDNKTALQDGIDIMQADDVNNAYVPTTSTQTFIGANGKGASWSTDMLDYIANQKAPIVTKTNTTTLSVSSGAVFIKNSGQSNRLMRRNTSATSVSISNLDTGSTVAANTYYYVYAVADSAATTFTVKISTSASSPTGLTNFELIGWFFNEASGSVLDVPSGFVGNVKSNGRDVPNVVTRYGTTADAVNDSAYGSDLTEATVRHYTSGRPVEVEFNLSGTMSTGLDLDLILDIDGSDQSDSEIKWGGTAAVRSGAHLKWTGTLAAGGHTFTIQAKVSGGATYNVLAKKLIVKEL